MLRVKSSLASLSSRRIILRAPLIPLICLLSAAYRLPPTVSAQSATATLSGAVVDQSGAVVPGVAITALNTGTSLHRQATTNNDGYFSIPLLSPGAYTVSARRDGFSPLEIPNVVLNVGDQRAMQIQLKAGNVSETVTVKAEANTLKESAEIGTVVDRQFVANLPLNGRSFQSLITLTPGVVLTNASANNQGQFSVNGQRANANYFTVDGVSANAGISAANVLGQSGSGALPGFSAAGSANSLVSVDALQEFKIQTSTYAPEFGRTPGAQVQILTRSGTNDFHGSLFEYFRNEALDANDWFANATRQKKPALRQNDFGGVIGGPLFLPRFGEGGRRWYNGRNRTFFFFSYEGLRLRLPQTVIGDTPSSASRLAARPQIQPFLNAYPLPNGPDIVNPTTGQPTGFARLNAAFSDPSSLDATSFRVDHTISSKLSLFGRYNYAPSEAVQRGGVNSTLNTLFTTALKGQTLTLGGTQVITRNISDETRFNYSKFEGGSFFTLDNFGGAAPPADSVFLPSFASRENSLYQFSLSGAGRALQLGRNVSNAQRQINLVNNLSLITGAHQLKFGVDYRRLSPTNGQREYENFVIFNGLTGPPGAISGNPIFISVGARDVVTLAFNNFSAYGQDTWRVTRRLTFTYGLRYEVNPPPKGLDGKELFTVQGLDNPATVTLAPPGAPLYKTTYGNFAPRFGLTYLLSERSGREMVIRGGVGEFYDLGTGTAATGASLFPYARSRTLPAVTVYPFVDPALAIPPAFRSTPPVTEINAFDTSLKLPRTYQFNVTIEQSLGLNQTLSASYVAAFGRRLLRQELLQGGTLNPLFTSINFTRNAASSDYHALQLKFQRRLSMGLQALASYTWSHSIDNLSSDSVPTPPSERLDPRLDRGDSDFDVRHMFNAAVTYDLPARPIGKAGGAILRDFSVDTILTTRSSTPVNVITGATVFGVQISQRPDLISGIPLYIEDPAAAGGRRINRAAFRSPPSGLQGTLGRNSLRGFSLYQMDFALRRQFNLTELVKLQFRVEFFNVFNHPNFANPIGSLSDALNFGRSTQSFGRSLGTGGTTGGLNPLYQVGGPRSSQLALRLQF